MNELDELIEALVEIGNHKRVKSKCEPQVMQSLELKRWMVKRTLYAWRLLEDELYKNARKSISETPISSEGAIHSNSECL